MKRAIAAALVLTGAALAHPPTAGFEGVKKGNVYVYSTSERRFQEEVTSISSSAISVRATDLDGTALVATRSFPLSNIGLDVARNAKVNMPERGLELSATTPEPVDLARPFGQAAVREETIQVGKRSFSCGIFRRYETECVPTGDDGHAEVRVEYEHAIAPVYPFTIRVTRNDKVVFQLEEVRP